MTPNANFWSGKQVCVTGGTGFLGFHLVQTLLACGARVAVLGLPPKAGHPLEELPQVRTFYGDMLHPTFTRAAVRDCEVIFHTAGPVATWGPQLETMVDQHCRGTQTVLEAMDPDATIVHTSSILAVGGSRRPVPLDEETRFNLAGMPVKYIRAKRASEEIALAAAATRRVLVVNPGYLIGPDDHSASVMGRFCMRFWKGRLFAAPRSGLNVVDVRDVALGHILAAERGISGRRYILGGENLPYAAFLRMLAKAAGMRPIGIVPVPRGLIHLVAYLAERRGRRLGREAYPSHDQAQLNHYFWYYSSERARRELGWSPRSIRESVDEAYRWHIVRQPIALRGFHRWWMRPAA